MYQDTPTDLIGRRVGNYVVERALAQGGMGSVFVARHPTLGREAAVKFIGHDCETPPELVTRFLSEARITANLRHPNIVDIFDFGELDGRLYYVMELLQGCDLAALLHRRGKFSVAESLDVLVQVASGLAAAHAVGVVHRDLKPANVFVLEGFPQRVKLMDFGIAKVLTSAGNQTSYGQIMGTPRYMSPEQAVGDAVRISPQSDIYSLGVIAYEMLTGVAPFEHDSPVMLLVMHVRDKVRPVRELAADCPHELAVLIEACLSKDPSARPGSANETLDRLEALRNHSQPVKGHEPRELVTPKPDAAPLRILVPRIDHDDTLRKCDDALAPAVEAVVVELLNVPIVESAREKTPLPLITPTYVSEGEPLALVTPARKVKNLATPKPTQAITPNTPTPQPLQTEPVLGSASVAEGPVAADRQAVLALGKSDAITNDRGPEGHTATVQLTESDRNVLNKLLMRMQRRGDFPAFVQNVGEVSKRADFEGSFSAQQLGTSILKDYALTAKLLRIVNSTYANRFGGKIYSIQHAIVILGFDRVRQLALSISLFKNQGNKAHASRISESAINSLVSGEISRELYADAAVDDPEQAVVCSMFRNLGRHLVLVYLPELYDQILLLTQNEHMTLNAASERVLGISMHKLGVGIAERWRLPQRMIQSMAVIPERLGQLYRDEDRLSALAEFSNQLCEIVSSDLDGTVRETALNTLTGKHKHLLTFKADDLTELLVRVQDSFEQRYASVLGKAAKTSPFSRNVSHLVDQTAAIINDDEVKAAPAVKGWVAPRDEPIAVETPTPQVASPVVGVRGIKAKRPVARLQLAKSTVDIEHSTQGTELQRRIAELRAELAAGNSTDGVMASLLKTIAKALSVPRLILLKSTSNGRELVICAGLGDDIEGLTKELRFPLSPALAATDPFSLAYHVNRNYFIEDCFSPKVMNTLPARYFEVIGSASLLLIHVASKTGTPYVLSADIDPPSQLPSQEQLQAIAGAKEFLAQVAVAGARP